MKVDFARILAQDLNWKSLSWTLTLSICQDKSELLFYMMGGNIKKNNQNQLRYAAYRFLILAITWIRPSGHREFYPDEYVDI